LSVKDILLEVTKTSLYSLSFVYTFITDLDISAENI